MHAVFASRSEAAMSTARLKPSPIGLARPMAILIVNPDVEIRQLVEKSIPELRPAKISLALSDDLASVAVAPPPDIVIINLKAESPFDFTQLGRVWSRWPDAQIIFFSPLIDIHLWAEA